MTLSDVSSRALMCPQNVAYIARLTVNQQLWGALKSKTGGGVEQSPLKDYRRNLQRWFLEKSNISAMNKGIPRRLSGFGQGLPRSTLNPRAAESSFLESLVRPRLFLEKSGGFPDVCLLRSGQQRDVPWEICPFTNKSPQTECLRPQYEWIPVLACLTH